AIRDALQARADRLAYRKRHRLWIGLDLFPRQTNGQEQEKSRGRNHQLTVSGEHRPGPGRVSRGTPSPAIDATAPWPRPVPRADSIQRRSAGLRPAANANADSDRPVGRVDDRPDSDNDSRRGNRVRGHFGERHSRPGLSYGIDQGTIARRAGSVDHLGFVALAFGVPRHDARHARGGDVFALPRGPGLVFSIPGATPKGCAFEPKPLRAVQCRRFSARTAARRPQTRRHEKTDAEADQALARTGRQALGLWN